MVNHWQSLKIKPWSLPKIFEKENELTNSFDEPQLSPKLAYLKGIMHALDFCVAQSGDTEIYHRAADYIKKLDNL